MFCYAQYDGGRTYTEPSVIMTGTPENGTEVRWSMSDYNTKWFLID